MIKDILNVDNRKWFLDFQKFGIKKWIIAIILMLMITDIVIILNIPFLREIMAFTCFTTIPGLLILNVLKLNKIEFLKKVVLSIGISIAFLMFTGLILNSLYPFILKPLSLMPVLVSFNLILICLALIAYIRNKDDFNINEFLNFKINLENKLTFMYIFPMLFPFMAILGTYLMNTTQNNVILLLMLFLIPIYIILIAFFKDKIHVSNYPFAIWAIGLSLLLMSGLTSQFIMGRDVHNELYCFRLTLTNFHWDLNTYLNPYNACLSITVLPAIYSVLSAMNEQYIFKLLFALIGSFIPLTVYIVAKKYIDEKYAFFAALLFVFQLFFIGLLGAVRQEIAVMFFFLVVMIILSTDINKFSKKVLFLIFMWSLLVSHYATAYASFVLLFPILLVPFIKSLIKERKINLENFDIILISLGFIAIWYILYANVQFSAGSHAIQQAAVATTTSGGGNTSFLAKSKGDYVLGMLGIKLKSIPNTISVVVHDLVFVTIGIGLLTIVRKHKFYRKKFGTEYLVGIILSIFLLALFVLMPYISIAYDVARLFFQLIIFLAPVFIIGAIAISKLIRKPKWDVAIILLLLIALFSCTTYLQYHFSGMPYSAIYEEDGIIRGESFIHTSELTGVNWLKEDRINNLTIYSDTRQIFPYNIADFRNNNTNTTFFAWNKTVSSGYIYLGYTNINKKKVYEIGQDITIYDLDNYSHLFVGKEKIYDSGGSQIWF